MCKIRTVPVLVVLVVASGLTSCASEVPLDDVDVDVSTSALMECDEGMSVMLTSGDFGDPPEFVCFGGSGGMGQEPRLQPKPTHGSGHPKREEDPPSEPPSEPAGPTCEDVCPSLMETCRSECSTDAACLESCGSREGNCQCYSSGDTTQEEPVESEPAPSGGNAAGGKPGPEEEMLMP